MSSDWIDGCYLVAAVCFVLGLKLMKSPTSARKGNALASGGMILALAATFFIPSLEAHNFIWIGIAVAVGGVLGYVSAIRVQMTAMPQMVALFNGVGGGAVALVALAEYWHVFHSESVWEYPMLITAILSLVIGSISFSGSLVAFAKLQELMSSKPLTYFGQQFINTVFLLLVLGLIGYIIGSNQGMLPFWFLFGIALLLGVLAVVPIGGADMPVVISLLNSFTGTAAGLAGFVLGNTALLIGGGLVGASGLILTLQMCSAMNRPLSNVLFGAFGSNVTGSQSTISGTVKSYSVDDAAILFSNANSVIIVPGYGMAVAQAQHVVKEFASRLLEKGIDVKYAIHPVAGRMPGHMNVLLAEADVPYDQLYDLDDINSSFSECDVALVIGANDVVNPAARHDPSSPIYGMPILDVDKSRSVIVCKRSMNPGFAGIENELFYADNTFMLFGDAKSSISKLIQTIDNY